VIYDLVRRAVTTRFGEKVVAIIVYGSVTRPEDFAGNVSDVDVAIITSEGIPIKDRLDLFSDFGFHVDAVFLTEEQLMELAEEGYPLAYYIAKDGFVIYGDGGVVENLDFRVTEKTLNILKKSSIAAMGLGVESYLMGMYNDAVSHLYHAVRYAVRWKAVEKKGRIPISNREVYVSVRELGLEDIIGETFIELAESRKEKVDSSKCKVLIGKTVKALAAIHQFEKTTSWPVVENELIKLKSKASLVEVRPVVKEKKLTWLIKAFDVVENKLLELEV